jgi:hypothetical protein
LIARHGDGDGEYASLPLSTLKMAIEAKHGWVNHMSKQFPYYKVWAKLADDPSWQPQIAKI